MDIINANLDNITNNVFENSLKVSKTLLLPSVHVAVVSKVPLPKKLIRITLPHRINNMSICVLVKDLNTKNYDKTTECWKRRWNFDLKKCKISPGDLPSVSFISLRELKVVYQTFVSKRRLAATFDLFLADRRIVHHLPTKLGKAFYEEIVGKFPVPITLTNCNVVKTVCKESNTGLFVVRGKGMTESMVIGNTSLSMMQIKENVQSVCETICDQWPGGGVSNIRSIYVQSSGTSLPLYLDETEATPCAVQKAFCNLPSAVKKEVASKFLKILGKQITEDSEVRSKSEEKVAIGIPSRLLAEVAKDLPSSRRFNKAKSSKRTLFKKKFTKKLSVKA